MPARNELVIRGNAVGLTASDFPNDSKFEQKILYLEKNGTTYTATKGTQTLTQGGAATTGDKLTIGNRVYTFKTALTGVKATALLTSDATAPSNGDTVQIGNITYTFKTTLTVSSATNGYAIFPYEVLIGASAAAALDNLKIAINNSGGTAGTEYSIGTTAHPYVTATTNTNTTQLIEARAFGTAANTYPVSEQSTHLSWGAGTMGTVVTTEVAGVNTIADEIKLTGTAATELDVLKDAINATAVVGVEGTDYSTGTTVHTQVTATTNTASTQVVEARNAAFDNASIATVDTTDTGSVFSFGAATLASGVRGVTAANTTTAAGSAGVSGDKNLI